MSKAYFSPTAVRAAEQMMSRGDDDKRLALAPEGVEKSGTGLDADGEDEEHQSEVS